MRIVTFFESEPKNLNISKYSSVCSTAHFMLNLEYSFLINLNIEIQMFLPSTEPTLNSIRELRYKFFKYQIWHQILGSFQTSSIRTILHKWQQVTCYVNKLGTAESMNIWKSFIMTIENVRKISIQLRYYTITVQLNIMNKSDIENIFLSCLISFRNGVVLGTNIGISIFKWIRNE